MQVSLGENATSPKVYCVDDRGWGDLMYHSLI